MSYYYLDSNQQPAGPASLDEIRTLARNGSISADPLVRPDGSADWKLLSSLTAEAPAGKRSSGLPFKSTLLGDLVGSMLNRVARLLSPGFVQGSISWTKGYGHYAVLVGAVLTLLYTIYAAIRGNSFGVFLLGLGLILALAVAQFAATRFLGAADSLIANTPSRISSRAFLECTGLLLLLFAIGILISGLTTAIRTDSIAPFVPALLLSAGLVYFSAVALHPGVVNVELGAGSAGEEAIGLISFFFKAWLKLVPLFFFLFAVLGCAILVLSFFSRGQTLSLIIQSLLPYSGMQLPEGLVGATTLLTACLLPILAYFTFLLQYLLLDVLRAILSVPGKLDALRR